jgi:thymidine kinase
MSAHLINSAGYLEIIIGSMFSGKTSELLDLYKKFTYCNIPVAIINHSDDTRYHATELSTHDKRTIPCIQTKNLKDVWNFTTEEPDTSITEEIILINEGQFFEDLYPCVVSMLSKNKTIYICGLDGDFERNKFGHMFDLIPLCDKITKKSSLCSLCKNGTAGIFSHRLSSETQQTLIGSDNYIPVCRKCYKNETGSLY